MAKKTHIKVRLVPESNPDSKFIYYAKKPTKGEKVKDKLKLKKYSFPKLRKNLTTLDYCKNTFYLHKNTEQFPSSHFLDKTIFIM